MLDRRDFIQHSAALAACFTAAGGASAALAPIDERFQFCAFTKFMQSLSFDELADAVIDCGFSGVEAPVRSNGHFTMAEAPDKLPLLVEKLSERGVKITVLCTDTLRADQPHAEKCLRTAAALGIKYYRMGFYQYDLKRSVLEQLDEIRPAIKDLAELNRELGLRAVYQNHSGADMVGAAVWDVFDVIREVPPENVALAYDIRHATIEAGLAWPAVFNAVQANIGAVFVKDFQWQGKSAEHVPLGEGRVDRKFFDMLRATNFAGPVSVHVEYLPDGDALANAAAIKRDFATLRSWLDA
jgi:sugar phosphate isomerase/epimerase